MLDRYFSKQFYKASYKVVDAKELLAVWRQLDQVNGHLPHPSIPPHLSSERSGDYLVSEANPHEGDLGLLVSFPHIVDQSQDPRLILKRVVFCSHALVLCDFRLRKGPILLLPVNIRQSTSSRLGKGSWSTA